MSLVRAEKTEPALLSFHCLASVFAALLHWYRPLITSWVSRRSKSSSFTDYFPRQSLLYLLEHDPLHVLTSSFVCVQKAAVKKVFEQEKTTLGVISKREELWLNETKGTLVWSWMVSCGLYHRQTVVCRLVVIQLKWKKYKQLTCHPFVVESIVQL